MASAEIIVLDPLAEDASNQPLQISGDPDNGVVLLEHDYPLADLEVLYASGPDTEGDIPANNRPRNRKITAKLRIVEPSGLTAATNLVKDPGAEGTSWTGIWQSAVFLTNAATITRDATNAYQGDYCGKVHTTGAAASEGVEGVPAVDPDYGVFKSGQTYRFDVYLKGAVGGESVTLFLTNTAGSGGSLNVTLTSSWARYSVTWTPGSDQAGARYAVRVNGTAAMDFYFDAASIVRASSAPVYFDGDTPGCYWSGTTRASSSIRRASGGKRLEGIVSDITAKVAKLNRYGGTFRRTLPNTGDQITFDVCSATISSIDHGKRWANRLATEITLEFEAKPYGRGAELALSTHQELTLPALSFTESTIPGDVPALGRLVISNLTATAQRAVVWGLTSIDAIATPSWIEAESGVLGSGAAATAVAGASGSGNNTATIASLSSTLATVFTYEAERRGDYRVFARLRVPNTNAGTVSVALVWTSTDGTTTNSTVDIDPALEGTWLFVDLGLVSSRANRYGNVTLNLDVRASSTAAGDDINVDGLVLFGTDRYGQVASSSGSSGTAMFPTPAGRLEIDSDGVLVEESPNEWRGPAVEGCSYEGDYLLVPPTTDSGGSIGAGSVRITVKACRRTSGDSEGVYGDGGIDDIQAQLYVTPRYLAVPTPS